MHRAGAARTEEAETGIGRAEYRDGHRRALDSLLLGLPGVEPGRMFGYPNYKVGGRMFACVYGAGVALKLPRSRVDELVARRGNKPFRPKGRDMREWVMLERRDSRSYARLRDLFRESIEFTGESCKRQRGR